MAAGRDHDVAVLLLQHAVVLPLDHRRADRRLLGVVEAELLDRCAHGLDADALVVGDERGGEAHDHGGAAVDEHADLLGVVHDLLGVLRADHVALAAQDALLVDDVRLARGEADGLHRAVADAFVAVLAIGLLQAQTVRHGNPSGSDSSCGGSSKTVLWTAPFRVSDFKCYLAAGR